MGFDLNSMSFNCWSSSLKCLVAHVYLKYTACASETTVLMRSWLRNKLLSCCSCGLQNCLRVWGHALQLSGGKTWTQFDSCRKKYIQLTDTAEPWLSKRNYFLPTSSLNKVRQNTVSFWYTFRNFRLCEFTKCQTSYVLASSLALISDISIIVHIFRCKSDKTVIFLSS